LQIDKLYLEGESSKIHLFPAPHFHEDKFREDRAITKDSDCLKNKKIICKKKRNGRKTLPERLLLLLRTGRYEQNRYAI